MPEIRAPIDLTRRTGQASLLALGFRPFFLAAGIAAVLLVAAWLAALDGRLSPGNYFPGTTWHAHEMLFGYAGAVIAGFLLTAVRNWSSMPTATGTHLAGLILLWLAARISIWTGVPGSLIALLDIAFFPAVAFSLWRPLWHGPNRNNRVFLALFAGMATASTLAHLDALGVIPNLAQRGQRLMLDLIVITLLLVGGRVMPFFTEAGLTQARATICPQVERLTFVTAVLLLVAHLAVPYGRTAGLLAIALGIVQLVRIAGWYDHRVWRNPMLGVLYAGFLWLAVGLSLEGLAAFIAFPPQTALHALTIGGVGVMTLGMMARVTLGHTGRNMEASRMTLLAFALVNVAAAVRALVPMAFPDTYQTWLVLSGVIWILAFGIFLWVYGPMLIKPRADGRPG